MSDPDTMRVSAADKNETAPMRLPESADELIALNANLLSDNACQGRWTVEDTAHAEGVEKMPADVMPLIAPAGWATNAWIYTQDEYCAEFQTLTPLADYVLRALNGGLLKSVDSDATVVVAGGAAAAPYFKPGACADSVDFYIAGVDSGDRRRLVKVAECIVGAMQNIGDPIHPYYNASEEALREIGKGLVCDNESLTQTLAADFIKVEFGGVSPRESNLRIVLRAYPSVDAIIHSFAVPPCRVAYDGYTACMTTMGAYANSHRVCVVDPARPSKTYEQDLLKYFECGYALGFVDLDPGAIHPGQRLELPHIVLDISSARCNGYVEGTISLPADVSPPRSAQTLGTQGPSDLSTSARAEVLIEWYGAERVNSGPLRGLTHLASSKITYGDSCPLCLEPQGPGGANSVTLRCGHTFHWESQGDECEGLSKWFDGGNHNCPVCRAEYDFTGPRRCHDDHRAV